jgi:hypothetical protein
MSNFIISQIRTYVPIIVGAFVSWLTLKGIELDPETQSGLIVALTGTLQAAYYFIVRIVEKKYPKAGILLGSATKPVYKEVK